jgi:hypothetical protein
MSDQGSAFLESVLKKRSVMEINKLGPYAVRLADRWAKEWPGKTRELEAAGTLVKTLKQRAEAEALNQWRSRIRAVRGETPGPDKEAAPPTP